MKTEKIRLQQVLAGTIVIGSMLPALAGAATTYTQITDVAFKHPPQPWQTLSTDRRTLTTTLPPSSIIESFSQELSVKATVTMSSTGTYDTYAMEPATNESSFPASLRGKITCSPSSSAYNLEPACRVNHLWAATLSASVTVPLRVKQAHSNTTHSLTWIIQPSPPGPYVASLSAPNVLKGNVTTMRVTLTANAPAAGTTVNWNLVPGNCFSQAQNSVPYGQAGLNNFTVPQGDRWKDFSVAVNAGCGVNSAELRTWVERINTNSSPYYRARSFTLLNPDLKRSTGVRAPKEFPKQPELKMPGRLTKPDTSASRSSGKTDKLDTSSSRSSGMTGKSDATSKDSTLKK